MAEESSVGQGRIPSWFVLHWIQNFINIQKSLPTRAGWGRIGKAGPQEALTEQNSYMYIDEYEFLTFYTVIKCQKVVSINDVKARNSSATILNVTLNFAGDKQSSGKRYKRS